MNSEPSPSAQIPVGSPRTAAGAGGDAGTLPSGGSFTRGPAPWRRYSSTRRSRSALPITETELRLIAALAIIGLSRRPKTG